MRHFSRILFLLTATFSSVTLGHAQMFPPASPPTPAPNSKLVINDNLASSTTGSAATVLVAKHNPITHWQQFSTTLSADVSHPPLSNEEIEVAKDPTYEWTGATSPFKFTSSRMQSTGLESVFPPISPLPAGQNDIGVHCTASYAVKDLKTGKALTAITVEGDLTVRFWSLVPETVEQVGSANVEVWDGAITLSADDGVFHNTWGSYTYYNLEVKDTQPIPQRYGHAVIGEVLSSKDIAEPNGPEGGSWYQIDYSSGKGTPQSTVPDKNGKLVYDNPPVIPPATTWADSLVGTVSQTFTAAELIPPYTSERSIYVDPGAFGPNGQSKRNPTTSEFKPWVSLLSLNTHTIVIYYGHAERNGSTNFNVSMYHGSGQ